MDTVLSLNSPELTNKILRLAQEDEHERANSVIKIVFDKGVNGYETDWQFLFYVKLEDDVFCVVRECILKIYGTYCNECVDIECYVDDEESVFSSDKFYENKEEMIRSKNCDKYCRRDGDCMNSSSKKSKRLNNEEFNDGECIDDKECIDGEFNDDEEFNDYKDSKILNDGIKDIKNKK